MVETKPGNNGSYTTDISWIIPVITNIILIIISVYLLIAFIYYGIKSGKWTNPQPLKSYEKLNAGSVFTCAVGIIALSLLRYIFSLAVMNIGYSVHEIEACQSLAGFAYIVYLFFLYSYYVFLWLRQRIFFQNKILNVSYNIHIKRFSFLSIVLVTGIWMALLIYYVMSLSYYTTEFCDDIPEESKEILWQFVIAAESVTYLVLISLYSYALLKIKTSSSVTASGAPKQEVSNDSKPKPNCPSKENQKTAASIPSAKPSNEVKSETTQIQAKKATTTKLKSIVSKACIFAVFSLICNALLNAFGVFVVKENEDRNWSQMAFDTNVFLTLIFLVFSFDTYKQILYEPCYKTALNFKSC